MLDLRSDGRGESPLGLDDPSMEAHVEAVVARHRGRRGAVISVLEEIQDVTGYLPEGVLRYVAQGLEIPLTQVTGVATFYSYFSLEPRGRHQIKLCLGTACHVRGAQRGLVHLESKLGIEPGGCTKDGEIGLEVVRCLGACGLAPVVVVNQETFRQVDEHRLDQILDGCRKGRSETAEPTP